MVAQACKSTRISSLGWVLKNVLTTVPVLCCYLFALNETRQGRITVGDMLAFTVILNRIKRILPFTAESKRIIGKEEIVAKAG